mmetsp:Transcript_59005/g.86516  ORF Transcript_59005/g.86516 Transcript_59005/m.86516 type:complete len:735 (+) Transcript_59005:110-2314(+)
MSSMEESPRKQPSESKAPPLSRKTKSKAQGSKSDKKKRNSTSKEPVRKVIAKESTIVEAEVVEAKTSKQYAYAFASHKYFTASMLIATFIALFAMDLWELSGPPPIENDIGAYCVMLVTFTLFLVELTLFTWSKEGYRFSFFWGLDLLACLSLIPDAMMALGVNIISMLGDSTATLSITRAGRAARAGTRAVRIIEVVKKQLKVREMKKKGIPYDPEDDGESAIGGKLGDGITEKVIVIVTLMLIASQVFGALETTTTAKFEHELENLQALYIACRVGLSAAAPSPAMARASSDTALFPTHGCASRRLDCLDSVPTTDPTCHFNLYFRQIVASHNKVPDECLHLNYRAGLECSAQAFDKVYDFTTYSVKGDCTQNVVRHIKLLEEDVWCSKAAVLTLRTVVEESISVTMDNSSMVFSNIPNARGQALVNILQVVFIILLMGFSSYLFQKDADKLVIGPLTRMAKIVAALSANPLAKIDEGGEGNPEFETEFVERAIKKFGKLLQIAFGEAGAEIIGTTKIAKGGEVNPMVAGKKMKAIFGFAILNHFNDCTDALQEDVMLYVNIVADIVHRAVKENEGAPNKNIGDAFLVAWKMPDDADMTKPVDTPYGNTYGDSCIKAFVRSCIETQASKPLRELTEHPKIQERLPGFKISMGYGLHAGWAIEGAIGSMLKIDASYLSPHVNLAARLETGTHQFGVDILFSDIIFAMVSPELQALCRKIDRVTVKGSLQPITL